MTNKPVVYAIAGSIAGFVGYLLFIFLPITQSLGPGIILGLSILSVRKILDKQILKIRRVVPSLALCVIGWIGAGKTGALAFDILDLQMGSYFAIFLSGAVSGALGAFFVLLSVNVLFRAEILAVFSFKALIVGSLIGCIVLPLVAFQTYLYVFLFVPWQACVLFAIICDFEE